MSITISFSKINPRRALFTQAFILGFGVVCFFTALADLGGAEREDRYAVPRRIMIERDLRARGITDSRVLAAMAVTSRHLFVPEAVRGSAYDDRPLPIGNGQTISQPYIVAYMSELLEIQGQEKVLEIGTGSGYQTAILAQLAKEVYSIEIIMWLSERAKPILDRLGFRNVFLKIGDGFFGWEERAPFDAILVTAAAPKVPEALWRQLREGGRIVLPLGDPGQIQRLVRIHKRAGKEFVETFTDVRFVPLTGAVQGPR